MVYVYLLAALGAVMLFYYVVHVEPQRVEITRHDLKLSGLPNELDGTVLCQVSDMHFTRPPRNTAAIMDALGSVKADLYLFTGDQIRGRGGMEEFLRLLPEIRRIASPGYLVQGNAEHRQDVPTREFARRIEEGGIRPLVNASAVHRIAGVDVQIVGVDDPHYRVDDFQKAYSGTDPGLFTILLCHSPDGLRNLRNFRADLALCGHTHAGQLRLPIIGALWANTRDVKLVQGWYG